MLASPMTHFAKAFHKRCVERRTINLFLEVNDQPAGVASCYIGGPGGGALLLERLNELPGQRLP